MNDMDYEKFFNNAEPKGNLPEDSEEREEVTDNYDAYQERNKEVPELMGISDSRTSVATTPLEEGIVPPKEKLKPMIEEERNRYAEELRGTDLVAITDKKPEWKPIDVFDVEIAVSKMDAGDIKELVDQAKEVEINSDEDAQKGMSLAMQARKMGNSIEKTRKEIVRPHLDFQRAVKAYSDGFAKCLKEMEKSLTKKIEAFQDAKEKEQKRLHAIEEARIKKEAEDLAKIHFEEELKRKAAIEAGKPPPPPPVLPEVKAPPPTPFIPASRKRSVDEGSSRIVVKWVFEVEDLKCIPLEYLQIDERAIREAIEAGVRQIPGLKIHEKRETVYRVK